MNRAFLETYNRELSLLYDRSAEFADEYPGIAERLGGLPRDRLCPGLAVLLEGAAFLAARVQLKLDSEFATFTEAFLEQMLPGYLAPTPAAMIVEAQPNYAEPDLVEGKSFPAGSYLDATYVEREQRFTCRFRLAASLELWPLSIDTANYFTSPAALQGLGLDVRQDTAAGLRLRVVRRTGPTPPDPEAPPKPGEKPALLDEVQCDTLAVHFSGARGDQVALYEHLLANRLRITLRYLDRQGDPVFLPCPPNMIGQIGFDDGSALFPEDQRLYSGFALLREFFVLPQRFLGVRLSGLRSLLRRVPAPACDLLIEFDRVHPRLSAAVRPETFRLHCAPAVNLFEEQCSRVVPDLSKSEYPVRPDSTPYANYEVHRVLDVTAHFEAEGQKQAVHQLYDLPDRDVRPQDALYYSFRRRPRRRTAGEQRIGTGSTYVGGEVHVSLYEPGGLEQASPIARLAVRTLCSNRHLTEQLPIGQSAVDFRLLDDVTLGLACISGPTPPRPSITQIKRDEARTGPNGEVMWRLINALSLNYLALRDRAPDDPAGGLRELLSLFSDSGDAITERQLRGITSVASRPITRSLRRSDGYHPARGLEVALTFDERAYEGTGIALMGAVLDRFFAEYATINSFTETVLISQGRGEVLRFPPRSGTGPLL